MSARRYAVSAAVMAAVALTMSACATSPKHAVRSRGGLTVVSAAASINVWGSILAQLGGTHVKTRSIITNPDTDPHDYEPSPADARAIADAAVFVANGIGYDSWAAQAVEASPVSNRVVIDVGDLLKVPADGNPHRWYSPADVEKVADAITAALKMADHQDAAYFDRQPVRFESIGLARYHRLINEIAEKYAGTPVGASESVFVPLSDALGLDLITPPGFLKAISEGTDPSAADKSAVDAQISQKKIKVYVFNSQNSTPDVAAQVAAARKAGIPVTSVTETLSPGGASFQDWQSAQLRALATALAKGTAR